MKIDKAHMEVIDRFGDRVTEHPEVHLDGGEDGLDVSLRRDHDGRTIAEIRYEPKRPELAAELGNDSDYVLLDWFMVHDVDVSLRSGRLTIVGYMAGAKGFRRNGEAQYEDGNTYTDLGGPLVRVRWDLV